jgi:hypothetical protein
MAICEVFRCLKALKCYMQIGVKEVIILSKSQNSKELPLNMQSTKLPNIGEEGNTAVFVRNKAHLLLN